MLSKHVAFVGFVLFPVKFYPNRLSFNFFDTFKKF